MALRSIVNQIQKSSLTDELIDRANRKERLLINGASRTAKAVIATSISKKQDKPLLVIVPTLEEANRWYTILELTGWKSVYIYPTSEGSPYESFDSTNEIIWGQLQVLAELIVGNNANDIAIITTERSLQPHLPPRDILEKKCITVKAGLTYDLDLLIKELANLGYERVTTIEQEGTFSRRGDILDVYPVSSELPIRLEFFGDEIDKIKEFDPINQRSLDSIGSINITPKGFAPIIADQIRISLPDSINLLLNEKEIDELLNNNTPEGMRRLLGNAFTQPSSILNYIRSETFIVLDEPNQCTNHCSKWIEHVEEHYNETLYELKTNNEIAKQILPNNLHKTFRESLTDLNKFNYIELCELIEENKHKNSFNIASQAIIPLPNQFGRMSKEIKNFINSKFSIWILSAQPSRASALLEEHDCHVKFVPNINDINMIQKLILDRTPVSLKANNMGELEGFILSQWKIVVITDKEFFGQTSFNSTNYIRRRKRASSNNLDPNKIRPGDYVVHRNHGIGQFQKIEKLSITGEYRDYLVVNYLDGKLSVAADQLASLGRYRATNGKTPQINKMGGASWLKTKERARKVIKKIAIDLVKLYAERSNVVGYSFPPDGPWQNEMEDSFPYEPTSDQIKAVRDVKTDMERNIPMDRLVCGDVGFGKTEVAVRAIFKAITSGKQVAMLAPTTVLAQQHWRTISERFTPYPIKVSLLNRFRTSLEKKEITKGLLEGTTDIVIGTHQLLGKSISFKKLGLLVIDEEQRFGVSQKERIKSIKKDIDVLTLSATPIPRTLYMSLSGVREMSLITTPPPSRRPIKTHLAAKDDEVIRSAILQEIDRGGQIFYVVPKIDSIEEVADLIRKMVPAIKLIVAHGQMGEGELESAMIAFNAGEAELLLCTTIIESGLDIPRVNTIIIEDSHMFGLSQLYQLRGRVGRSGVQAHAWLFYPNRTILSDKARQRLRAIQEFAQLGSGYQLAMRDMEIRGVGNLLGVEQSGQMESIGFDLYMEMLQETLADLQGQDIPTIEETQVDLQVTAFIPGDWIVNSEEKLSAYRKATQCRTEQELLDLALVWSDRYGSIPASVSSLLEILKLKLLSRKCGFSRIKQDKHNIILETTMLEPAFRKLRKGLSEHLQGRLLYNTNNKKVANVVCRGLGVLSVEKQISQLIEWLEAMLAQIPCNEVITINQQKDIINKKNELIIKV